MPRLRFFVPSLALIIATVLPSTLTAQDNSTIYLYRPGKFNGKGLEPSVFLDERKVLDMDNGRYVIFKLAPGRHVLRSNEKDSEIDQNWEAGKTYYVKLTIQTGMWKGHGQMGMVTEKLALREMAKLKPLDRENTEEEAKAILDFSPFEPASK